MKTPNGEIGKSYPYAILKKNPSKRFMTGFFLLAAIPLSQAAHAASCIPITSLPYTITNDSAHNNKTYCLNSDLSFSGAAGAAAITLNPGVNNVVIDMGSHSLSLVNGQEVGVQLLGTTAANVSYVTVKNGAISSPSTVSNPNSMGINLTDPHNTTNAAFNGVTVSNMSFNNLNAAVQSYNYSDKAVGLTVTNSQFSNSAFGVQLTAASNYSILNSSFTNMAVNGIGGNADVNGLIKNDTFTNVVQGVNFGRGGQPGSENVPSHDLIVTNSTFSNGGFKDVSAYGMNNVTVTYDTFNQDDFDFAALTFSNDFTSTGSTIVTSGLVVDHDIFNSTATQMYFFIPYQASRMIQIGSEIGEFSGRGITGAQNVSITNSTFTQTNGNQFFNGMTQNLQVFAVNGMLVQGNKFNDNATGYLLNSCSVPFPYPFFFGPPQNTIPDKTANVQLGSSWGGPGVQNVLINGNTIGGGEQVGIYSETGPTAAPNSNIVISNNTITAAEQGILLDNTIYSLITGNTISGVNGSACYANGTGIQLDGPLAFNPTAASSTNAIVGNTITNNRIGIDILQGAVYNLLLGNTVTNNAIAQVINNN